MRQMLFVLCVLCLPAVPYASDAPFSQSCDLVKCDGEQCGCTLKKQGWQEVARCDDHQWSYLIEKGAERKLCVGIHARGGAEESPCSAFSGDVASFQAVTDAGKGCLVDAVKGSKQ